MKKFLAITVMMALLLCSVSCTFWKPQGNGPDAPPDPIENQPVVYSSYADVIDHYKSLLRAKINQETLAEPSASAGEIENALVEIARDCEAPSAMGYATKDLNGDGMDELVLLNKNNRLYALLTERNHSPVLLLNTTHMSSAITPDGTVYAYRSNGNQGEYVYVKQIVDGRLEGLEFGKNVDGQNTVQYYKIENGNRTEITSNEKRLLDESVRYIVLTGSSYHTKTTGFRFVSAVMDAPVQSTAPVADFSSYEGVLAAYKIIVESFSNYSKSEWVKGTFDNLFQIADNATYDIFHQLFYAGMIEMRTEESYGGDYVENGNQAYGYAKKDLNGDGVDELILLTDHYEILALFTMKDGKAKYVHGASGAWIDENGYMRKALSTGGVVSRDGEFFVYALDGIALKPIVGGGYRVNVYLEKEGWYRIDGNTKTEISKEEGEAMYAAYDILPHRYCMEEYTRTFSGIEFSSLFDGTLASQAHLNTFSNNWFINGDTLTVSTISDGGVTFSFQCIYVESEFDPETNPNPESHTTVLTGEALRDGARYRFEIDGVRGYLEFAVNSAWVVVTESQNEYVESRAYLFNSHERN